jgi:hypothetical protein
MGLCNDPMCRKCGTEEETSVHILCECEALAETNEMGRACGAYGGGESCAEGVGGKA